MEIIGISGQKRSGKDTSALIIKEFLEKKGKKAVIYSFAYPLKLAVSKCFAISMNTIEHKKEVQIDLWKKSPRQLLQQVGDKMRSIDQDVFLKNMRKKIKQTPKNTTIIISDVRFDNEAKFVRSLGGVIIIVERNNIHKNDKHITEQGINPKYSDYTIYNNLSKTLLKKTIKTVLF